MARVTFRNSRGIKMSVELIRKYNISPSGLGHARPKLSTQFLRRRNSKFEVIIRIRTRGEGEGRGGRENNLKIFADNAQIHPDLTFHSSIDRIWDSEHSVRAIRSDFTQNREYGFFKRTEEENDSNGWNAMIQVKRMFHRTNVVGSKKIEDENRERQRERERERLCRIYFHGGQVRLTLCVGRRGKLSDRKKH